MYKCAQNGSVFTKTFFKKQKKRYNDENITS